MAALEGSSLRKDDHERAHHPSAPRVNGLRSAITCSYSPAQSNIRTSFLSGSISIGGQQKQRELCFTNGKTQSRLQLLGGILYRTHAFRDFCHQYRSSLFRFSVPETTTQIEIDNSLSDDATPEAQQISSETRWWTRIKNSLTPRTRSILLLNLLTILYGSNTTIIKETERIMDPATLSTIRFFIAALAFSPFLCSSLKDDRIRRAGFELGFLASVGYLSQCIGLTTSDAGRASFICAFTVIVVPLLAGLSGSHIPKITWISAATALVGIALLESSGAPVSIGDLWNFVSAVFFGIHMLRTEYFSRLLPMKNSLPLLSLQLWVITWCSGMWCVVNNISSGTTINEMVKAVGCLPWIPLLYTGLVSTAFCLWIEIVTLRDVTSTEAAIVYTAEPLWGAAFAWSFLGERWGALGWLGACFILGGSLTMQVFGRIEGSHTDH